ncbi:competence protein ComK [Macrococcus brunensis]|uniref:competence protein ComK n=1 Tax=Macrococcus brunensis TaxID=198483 RepID=UPI001EF0D700|nr:competence protein ComK [Macrococcus brunensis]ULG72676.1 competence protein ComK [Macrococcus brunensis]
MQHYLTQQVVYIRRTNQTRGQTEIAYYNGEIEWVDVSPDFLLNQTLKMVNSSLTASRKSVKESLKFAQYTPVIIDASQNLVFFPLHPKDSYEMCYINNQHYLQAVDHAETMIYFTNGRSLTVKEKSAHVVKYYNRALQAADFYSKMKKRFL